MGKTENPQKTPVDPASPTGELVTNNNGSNEIETASSDELKIVQQNTESQISSPASAELINSVSISFQGKEKGAGDLNIDAVATIDPVNGFDGSSTTNGNVEFLVKLNPGWHTPELSAKCGDADITVSPSGGNKYSITTNNGKGFTDRLEITVTASKIKNKLQTAGSNLNTVYLLGTFDGKKDQPITSAGAQLSYEGLFNEGAAPIRIAVPASVFTSQKSRKITVNIKSDGTGAKDLVRTGETTEISGVKCEIFAFKPYEVDRVGAEKTENTDSTVYELNTSDSLSSTVLKVSTVDGTDYSFAKLSAGSFDDGKIEYKNKDLTFDGDVFDSNSLTRDTYRMTGEKKNVVAFTLTKTKQVDIKKVYAELRKTSGYNANDPALQTILAKSLAYTETSGSKRITCYGIDLTEIDDALFTEAMTLDIKADTEFLEESEYATGFNNHKIEFTGALETVEISAGSSGFSDNTSFSSLTKLKKNPYENDDTTLDIAIKPIDGYDISKGTNYNKSGGNSGDRVVTVSYDKVVRFTTTSPVSGTFYVKKSKTEEMSLQKQSKNDFYDLVADIKLANNTASVALSSLGDDLVDLAKEQNPTLGSSPTLNSDAVISLKNIKIDIKTELASDVGGKVTVEGVTPDMSYNISGKDITRVEDTDEWTVGEEADLLTVTVNSSVKPSVRYENKSDAESGATVTGSAGSYTAKIPVSLLKTEADKNGNPVINAKIFVEKGTQTLHVWRTKNTADFPGQLKIVGSASAFTEASERYKDGDVVKYDVTANANNDSVALTNNSEVTVTLYPEAGSLFEKVTYKARDDKDAKEEEVSLSADGTEATFTVSMTDDIDVFTKVKDTYYYEVTYTQNGVSTNLAASEGNGVYAVPAGVTYVKVGVYSGPNKSTANWSGVYSARAFDGGAAAACGVSIGGTNNSEINLTLSGKDSGEIRLDIKGKKTSGAIFQLKPSITIRQDKMAEAVVIKDKNGNLVSSVSLLPGETKGPYDVEMTSGSLSLMNGNVGLEITRDPSKSGESSKTVTNNKMTVTYDNMTAVYDTVKKTLVIEGMQGKKGNDAPRTVRFYDVAKRESAIRKNESDKLCVVTGSEVSVKLDSPAVALVTPEVVESNTVHNLQLRLSSPGFEEEEGVDAWYLVTIAGEPISKQIPTSRVDVVDNDQNLPTPYDNDAKYHYYENKVWIKKDGASQDIVIPVYYEYDAAGDLKEGGGKSYTLTVELVQKAHTAGDGAIWTVGSSNLIVSNKKELKTKTAEAIYPTSLFLSSETATVYTGQKGQKVATATFGDMKGVRQLRTSFVNVKTGVAVDTTNWAKHGVSGCLTSATDLEGGVYVNAEGMDAAKTLPKDLGLKVSAYAGRNTAAISKVIALRFVNGVGNISFESGNNRILYRQTGKKATLKLTAVVNNGNGVKTQNANRIVYSLGDGNGKESEDSDYKLGESLRGTVSVNPKNGMVTVSKDYVYKASESKFSVIAAVAGTDVKSAPVYVTISETPQEMGGLVIVDKNNKIIAQGESGSLSAELFMGGAELYVRALNVGAVASNNKYKNEDYAGGVGFTSGNTKALTIDKTNGRLTLVGASGSKAVKITAVNTDGSKKVKKEMLVTLTGPKNFGINIVEGAEGKWDGNTKTYRYSGAMKEKFGIVPIIYVTKDVWRTVPQEYYKNLNISIKNAKKTERVSADGGKWFEIVKSAPITTITISDRTDKSVEPVTYTIEQSPATPTKGVALNIKTVTKVTEAMLESARNAATAKEGEVSVEFQITGKNAGEYAGKYVMLTPDYSQTKLVGKIAGTENYKRADSYFLGGKGEKRVLIGEGGKFTLKLDMYRKTVQERIPDTYKMIAAVGEKNSKGEFEFASGVKATTISVKLPGKAPKKLEIETNGVYKISASGGTVPFDVGVHSAYDWELVETSTNNYALNAMNADGSVNKFTKYFYVKKDTKNGNKYVLGMNTEKVTATELEALLKDPDRKDWKGFVNVTSKSGADSVETVPMEINVDLVQTGSIDYKASETYRGATAVVKFYDAHGNALDLYGAALDENAAAQTGIVGKVKLSDDKKSVTVEVGEKAGENVSVDLKVIADDSAFAEATGASDTSSSYLQKNGDSVKVDINVADPTAATEAAEIVTRDENIAFRADVDKKGYESDRDLAADDKNKRNYNSYFEAGGVKKYVLRVDVKSKIEGAEVNYVALDKTRAGAAVKGDMITVTKGKNNEILLSMDQSKFLKQCETADSGVTRGGTVKVPVNVKFTISKIKEQAIDLNVKMPYPKTYAEAVAAMESAESNLESLTPDDNLEGETSAESLERKINAAFRVAVPIDTDAVVTPDEIKLQNPKDGKYEKVTVTVQKTSSLKEEDYKGDFVWNVPGDTKWNAEDLIEAINKMLEFNGGADNGKWLEKEINALTDNKAAGKIVDNSYTKEDFVKDLTAMLEARNVMLGRNMVLEATEFTRTKRATRTESGLITINIRAKNSEDKATDFSASKYNIKTTLNIAKIANLGEEGARVEKALASLDYEQAIYDALGQGDIDGLEQRLLDKIKSTSEGALTNSKVTVAFAPVTTVSGEDNYNANNKVKSIAINLPDMKAGSNQHILDSTGYLKFEVLLKLEGMTDYRIDYGVEDPTNNKKVLNEKWSSEDGKTFQRLDQIKFVFANNSGLTEASAANKVLTWTQSGSTLGTAKFEESITITDTLGTDTEKKVKSIIDKIIDGMYLNVSVSVDERAKGAAETVPVKGVVTITDNTRRSPLDMNTNKEVTKKNEYKFSFELPVMRNLAQDYGESRLDDPTLMTKEQYDEWKADMGMGSETDAPSYDRMSGLKVGKPERIEVGAGKNTVTYRVPLSGTLKYVQGWESFSSDTDEQKGYYAAVRIPIPEELRKIGNTDNSTKTFIQWGSKAVSRYKGTSFSKTEGDVLDLVMALERDATTGKVKSQAAGGVNGFKVVVDYNSMGSKDPGTGNVFVTADTGSSKNTGNTGVGDKEYALTTYIFDMSNVVLDNSSYAKIELLPEITKENGGAYLNITPGGEVEKAMSAQGDNGEGGELDVVVGSGTLRRTYVETFPKEAAYYVAVGITAPDYVKSSSSPGTPGSQKVEFGKGVGSAFKVDADVSKAFEPIKAGGVLDKAVVVYAINTADLRVGKKDITVKVDWDGVGEDWEPKYYTFDFSKMTYDTSTASSHNIEVSDWAGLKKAFAEAPDGAYIKLTGNVTNSNNTDYIEFGGKELSLDLGGYTLSSPDKRGETDDGLYTLDQDLFVIRNGGKLIVRNGEIKVKEGKDKWSQSRNAFMLLYGSELTVERDVTIDCDYYGWTIGGQGNKTGGAKVTFRGTLNSWYGPCVEGTGFGNSIVKIEGATINTTKNTGMYLAGGNTTTVSNSKITGSDSGIEVRAGNLTVCDGSVITSKKNALELTSGDGQTSLYGAGIAVSEYRGSGGVVVGLSDCKIESNYVGIAATGMLGGTTAGGKSPAGYVINIGRNVDVGGDKIVLKGEIKSGSEKGKIEGIMDGLDVREWDGKTLWKKDSEVTPGEGEKGE